MLKINERNNERHVEVNLNRTSHIPLHTSQRGITLIALIITIIIMLILVAVTITVAVNGGLFNYAGRAGKETNEAIENEKLLAEGIINGQTIDDILGIAVKDDWYGKPATELPTDEDRNYHIKTCAELAKFASMVNDGNDFAGKTVYLDKNLDLQGNESKQWTPIGYFEDWENCYGFSGTFLGQNHYIEGVYIKNATEQQSEGFFSYVNGSIQNLILINGEIINTENILFTGGLTGILKSGRKY